MSCDARPRVAHGLQPDARTLASLAREAAAVSAEFEALARPLGSAQLHWSPAPSAWSIAQCLEHLAVTAEAARPSFATALWRAGRTADRGMARAASRASLGAASDSDPSASAPVRPGRIGRWLIEHAGPRSRRRVVAPRHLAPDAHPEDGALERFLAGQGLVLDTLALAEGLDVDRKVLAAPISRLLPVSLGEVLAIAVAHTRRHLEQAHRVRGDARFPA